MYVSLAFNIPREPMTTEISTNILYIHVYYESHFTRAKPGIHLVKNKTSISKYENFMNILNTIQIVILVNLQKSESNYSHGIIAWDTLKSKYCNKLVKQP